MLLTMPVGMALTALQYVAELIRRHGRRTMTDLTSVCRSWSLRCSCCFRAPDRLGADAGRGRLPADLRGPRTPANVPVLMMDELSSFAL